MLILGIILAIVVSIAAGLTFAGVWRVFEKAGKPGWASLVPIYNAWVMVEIIKKPVLWFVLLLIPCVQYVFMILVPIQLAKVFGKSTGYGLGLALLGFVFFPMLGLGPDQYHPELADADTGGGGGGRRPRDEDEYDDEPPPPPRRPRR